jgi:sterol desaturase/sphingolipid hydroxylase (fatty acid hydroxylase superfamily)
MWEIHKYHHAGETLTFFNTSRLHPIECVANLTVYSATVGVVLGLHKWLFHADPHWLAFGTWSVLMLIYNLHGNLRHSRVPVRFGWLQYVFSSPVAHQIHHSLAAEHIDKNFATWLPIGDLILGTFHKEVADATTLRLGIDPESNRRWEAAPIWRAVLSPLGRRWRIDPAPAAAPSPDRPALFEPTEHDHYA